MIAGQLSAVGRELSSPEADSNALPPELATYTLGVFSQMLGEGIAMSSLAFYLTRLGAKPLMVGVAVSCFSVTREPLGLELSRVSRWDGVISAPPIVPVPVARLAQR